LSIDLGNRLRYVRTQHGLSQRQLAKRTGVTNSTISLIESNQSNPSVGALKRILDGIPIGLAEFFAIEPEISKQAFYQAEELVEIGRGRISYRQVGDNLLGRALQILTERYQPGADTGLDDQALEPHQRAGLGGEAPLAAERFPERVFPRRVAHAH